VKLPFKMRHGRVEQYDHHVRNTVPNSFTQPYFGADVCWPRLVTLLEGNQLVLDLPTVQWNTADIDLVAEVLPRTGALITRIDRAFSQLADMSPDLDVWTKHDRVGTVVIHGAYNHDAESSRSECHQAHDAAAELTKAHKVVKSAAGATVHILSEDFFRSFCNYYLASPKVAAYAFNRALTALTGLTLRNARSFHEEQFTQGVTAPYYDLVCAHREPAFRSLTCSAYRARYVAPRAS
jgi:hypothetical protein